MCNISGADIKHRAFKELNFFCIFGFITNQNTRSMHCKNTNLEKAKQNFEEIISTIEVMSIQSTSFHTVEYHIFNSLLQVGKHLLLYYISLLCPISEYAFSNKSTVKIENKGVFKRLIFTVFGEISFSRKKFYSSTTNKIYYPLDQSLQLHQGKYSYRLHDWIGLGASDQDFRSSIELLNRIFSYNLQGMQSERIAFNSSIEVDNFYNESISKNKNEEGKCFAVGFDDKGIPIKSSEIDIEHDSKAVRLGKGQKRGVKKHCTVSVGYSFNIRIRSPEDITNSLFREQKLEKTTTNKENNNWAQNKHIRGFLSGKDTAINYGFNDILKRKKDSESKIVVLIDGDKGLEKAVKKVISDKGINSIISSIILDFIHVTEYLWKAANANFGEKSKERVHWVKAQCLLLLKSKVREVIKNIEKFISKYESNITKTKVFQAVITYFKNHQHMMDYKTYLKLGFPIATGAVESACGHFVQSRMEKNGMRWSMDGAQKILNLRAINKNKDWEEYMKYYIKKEQEKIGTKYKMVA